MTDEVQNTGIQFEDIVPWVNEQGDTGLSSRLKLKRNFDKIKAWMDNNALTATMVANMIEQRGSELFVTKTFFNSLFQAQDENGDAIAPNNTAGAIVDRLKILVGTYTDQYLSALGLGSDGSGGGIDIDAMWTALGNADLTKQIDISHISTALSSYATQTWVTAQLNAMKNEVKLDNGVITIAGQTITPVTSVAMTVPLGLNVSGSPITKTGTFAVTYASGYEGFTTALKQKIEALFSWFEVDENGNVKTKDYTDGGTTKHRGFYSPSFISALGMGDDGSAGSGDVTWALLENNTDRRQIAISHLTDALAGYATQSWVNQQSFATQSWVQNQGYATTAALNALEFVNNAVGAEGYVTLSTNKNNSFVIDLTHQHSWFEIQDRPDTFAGFGLAAELNSTLSGYVTQATFNALEYMNQATGADGVLTLTTNKSNKFIVDFTHQHSFLELVDRPTTLAGYGITDATIANLMGSSSKGGSTTPVYWNGSAWVNCTSYGSASVNYATSAGSASSAAYATSAGSASSANYATSAGSANSANYASTAGAANNTTFYINGTTSDLPRLVLHISQVHYTRIMMDSSGDIHIADEGSPSAYKGLTAGSLTAKGNLYVSTNNTTGGGIILSDDGDIVDNNDGYCAMRFSNGVQIYSANRGGSAVITLGNGGGISCGSLYSTSSVTALSDARKKDIQGDVNLSIEQIALAPAVKFLWKDRREEGMQAGTIAQYWQGVLPEVVTEKDDVLGMSYGVTALIASIVTAKKVVDHERRIKELERENEILKEQVKQLKAA